MIANLGAYSNVGIGGSPAANTDNPRAGLQAEFSEPAQNELFPIDPTFLTPGNGNNPGGGINYGNDLPDWSLYQQVTPRGNLPVDTTTDTTDTTGGTSLDNMANLLDRLFGQSVFVPSNPQSDATLVPTTTATSPSSILPIIIMAGGAALVGWWYYKKHKKGGDE
jgi:hypothetical protein